MMRAAAALLPALALPAAAELQVAPVDYICDAGAMISTAYVNDGETWAVLVMIEDRMAPLWQEMSASGARYGDPAGGPSYVWWTKGTEATLYWKDAAGQESVVLQTCVEQGVGE
ncbi:MliC family protein [Rhodobacter sp. Har01]|uniref:MliC family protein n=1 Tax=Rhodobacter sp. Har01 TaxID=2883999 RepID=UPI001D0626B5|nr:MliC family protein [Rhodobacter sp. Har01]MCB6177319.1 MliC family protein [Rhodobacter sp. Har01]